MEKMNNFSENISQVMCISKKKTKLIFAILLVFGKQSNDLITLPVFDSSYFSFNYS